MNRGGNRRYDGLSDQHSSSTSLAATQGIWRRSSACDSSLSVRSRGLHRDISASTQAISYDVALTLGMDSCLNIPQRVVQNRLLIAGHLLLLVRPIRQLDFVREEVAPRQRVPQAELRSQRADPLARLAIPVVALDDLDDPVIVRVSDEASHAVRGDLLLEVHIGYWWAEVVRVQGLVGRGVAELDACASRDVGNILGLPIDVWVAELGRVDDAPVVIGVNVWV